MSIRMLRTQDIYDLYACEFILSRLSDAESRSLITARVDEIHELYLTAGKQRIRAEARFLGARLPEHFTFNDMIAEIRKIVGQQLQQVAPGEGDILSVLLNAHQAAGMDMSHLPAHLRPKPQPKPVEPSVKTDWFKGKDGENGRLFNDPKWFEITKAYIALEEAKTTTAKILAIDHLNDLQHNSFHLLIDLQTGRMLEGKSDSVINHEEARKNVQEVLDIKRNAKTPQSYLDKVSSDVRKLWQENRAVLA